MLTANYCMCESFFMLFVFIYAFQTFNCALPVVLFVLLIALAQMREYSTFSPIAKNHPFSGLLQTNWPDCVSIPRSVETQTGEWWEWENKKRRAIRFGVFSIFGSYTTKRR